MQTCSLVTVLCRLSVGLSALVAVSSRRLRPFPRPALRRRAAIGAARAPAAPGHAVPRWTQQVRPRSVDDNRHHVSALKMTTLMAVLRDVATEGARGMCAQHRFPLADARPPVAGGLRNMASAPGWGNLHAPPGGLQQLSPPLPRAHLAHPSRLSHGNPRATPGGSVPPQPGLPVRQGRR